MFILRCLVAFCFYNLSSIVNGLVYFDQFSLLSTTHLLLVLLGIAILLSGVSVISFPPEGGRGVDIGMWTEGEPPTELVSTGDESDVEAQDDEPYEDEPLPTESQVQSESTRGRSQAQIGLGLNIITEPPEATPTLQLSPGPLSPSRSSHLRNPSSQTHIRQQTDSALLRSPPRSSRSVYTTSTGGAEPTISTDGQSGAQTAGRRRRRTTLEPGASSTLSPLPPPFPNSLSPSASALSGFSIGLSPISPGFSIVPRERRRRPTGSIVHAPSGGTANERGGDGQEGNEAVSTEQTHLPSHLYAFSMRRVVSEGDASRRERQRRQADAAGPAGGASYGTVGDGDLEGGSASEGQSGEDSSRRAKGRWKWLRDVLPGLRR